MMFHVIQIFYLTLSISIIACSSSEFTSGGNRNKNSPPSNGTDVGNSGKSSDQNMDNGKTLSTPFTGKDLSPSLASDSIEKTIWHGCCPSYMAASPEDLKNVNRKKPNWAARAYSKILRFSFERIDQTEFKLEKKLFGHYEDPSCEISLAKSDRSLFKLPLSDSETNLKTSVKLSYVSKDGSSAHGVHTVRDQRGGSVSLLDQKVEYSIKGGILTEVITLDSKSFVEYEGYEITCQLKPLMKN